MKFYILLLLTLCLRVLSEINNPLLTSDHSIQIEATKNFIQSGKFANSYVESADLSHVHYNPLKLWPVGLSLIIFIINFFTNNLIYSEIIFQALGAVLVITGVLKLLKYSSVSSHIINLFLLLFAFNSAPFSYLGSTDLFTAGLFLWIVYFTLLELNNNSTISYKNLLIISLLSFIAAILRFACIPNLVIIPLVFFVVAILSKNKKSIMSGSLILFISLGATLLFYKQFPFSSGRTGFIDNIKSGTFYFSHIKWFDPFSLKAFLYTRPIEFRLPNNPTILFLYRITLLFSAIIFLLFILSGYVQKLNFIKWYNTLKNKIITKIDMLTIVFICTFLVVTSFIALQSLTVPAESNSFGPSWMPHFWTHVYSTRYFVYIIVLIIVLFFVAYYQREKEGKNTLIFKSMYLISIFWAISYWLFVQYQFYAPNGNGAGSQWVNESTSIEVFKEINKIHAENPEIPIVYAHYESKYKEGLITNYAYSNPTNDYETIIKGDFSNSRKLVLIISMPSNLSNNEIAFLAQHKHSILREFNKEKLVKIDLL